MSVLEAIEKLEKLNSKIESLNVAINRLNTDTYFSTHADIIFDIQNEIIKERDVLKDRLEKTPLVNTR